MIEIWYRAREKTQLKTTYKYDNLSSIISTHKKLDTVEHTYNPEYNQQAEPWASLTTLSN